MKTNTCPSAPSKFSDMLHYLVKQAMCWNSSVGITGLGTHACGQWYECWLTHLRTRNSGNRAPTLLLKMVSPFPWYIFVPLPVLVLSPLQKPIRLHIWSKSPTAMKMQGFLQLAHKRDVLGYACISRHGVLQLRVKKGGEEWTTALAQSLSPPHPTLGWFYEEESSLQAVTRAFQ